MLFLLRLNIGKKPAPAPSSRRVLSPWIGSTLITSAPRSASTIPQVGPITMWVNSTTRRPASGCGALLTRLGSMIDPAGRVATPRRPQSMELREARILALVGGRRGPAIPVVPQSRQVALDVLWESASPTASIGEQLFEIDRARAAIVPLHRNEVDDAGEGREKRRRQQLGGQPKEPSLADRQQIVGWPRPPYLRPIVGKIVGAPALRTAGRRVGVTGLRRPLELLEVHQSLAAPVDRHGRDFTAIWPWR